LESIEFTNYFILVFIMNTLRSLCFSTAHTMYSVAKNTVSFLCSDIYDDVKSIVQRQEPTSTKCLRAASVALRVMSTIGMVCWGPSCIVDAFKMDESMRIFEAVKANILTEVDHKVASLCVEALRAKFCPSSAGFSCFPKQTALTTLHSSGTAINSTVLGILENTAIAAVDSVEYGWYKRAATQVVTVVASSLRFWDLVRRACERASLNRRPQLQPYPQPHTFPVEQLPFPVSG
jgi:hypothetical protein